MEQPSRYRSNHWRYLIVKPFFDMFVFSGRSTRTEALGFVLFVSIFVNVPQAIAGDGSNPLFVAAGLALGLALHLPIYALVVRRAHDQDRSAKWVLLPIAQDALTAGLLAFPTVFPSGATATLLIWQARPDWSMDTAPLLLPLMVTLILGLSLFLAPETPGPNRYGPNPRLSDAEPQPGAA